MELRRINRTLCSSVPPFDVWNPVNKIIFQNMQGGFYKRWKVNAVLARTFVWFTSLICCLLLIKTKLTELCGRSKVRAVVCARARSSATKRLGMAVFITLYSFTNFLLHEVTFAIDILSI